MSPVSSASIIVIVDVKVWSIVAVYVLALKSYAPSYYRETFPEPSVPSTDLVTEYVNESDAVCAIATVAIKNGTKVLILSLTFAFNINN